MLVSRVSNSCAISDSLLMSLMGIVRGKIVSGTLVFKTRGVDAGSGVDGQSIARAVKWAGKKKS